MKCSRRAAAQHRSAILQLIRRPNTSHQRRPTPCTATSASTSAPAGMTSRCPGGSRQPEPDRSRKREAGNAAERLADCPGRRFHQDPGLHHGHQHASRRHRPVQDQQPDRQRELQHPDLPAGLLRRRRGDARYHAKPHRQPRRPAERAHRCGDGSRRCRELECHQLLGGPFHRYVRRLCGERDRWLAGLPDTFRGHQPQFDQRHRLPNVG